MNASSIKPHTVLIFTDTPLYMMKVTFKILYNILNMKAIHLKYIEDFINDMITYPKEKKDRKAFPCMGSPCPLYIFHSFFNRNYPLPVHI